VTVTLASAQSKIGPTKVKSSLPVPIQDGPGETGVLLQVELMPLENTQEDGKSVHVELKELQRVNLETVP